jgi:chemotaxis protein MotB
VRRAALLFLLLSACIVPKKKFEAEVATNADLRSQLDATGHARDALSTELTSTTADLQAKIAELEAARAALDTANGKLAGKIAEAGAMQADIDQMKQALAELERRKAEADASLKSYRDLVARFQSMIDAGTLRVKVVDGRMIVELATDILFPAGSATLSAEGKATIAQVASVLASIPDRDFQVAGHTDNVPISTDRFPSNWDLGAARAITVTELLIGSGLPAARVSAASFADTQPADSNDTKEGKAHNRRIEIIVVPDLSQLPGYEELQKIGH